MHTSSPHALYFSPTGTTRRVAAAIARGIAGTAPIAETDLTHAPVPARTLAPETVAILAAPVYGGHIPPVVLKRLEALRGNDTPAVIVAVYGNRAFGRAVAELADFAAQHGFRPIAAAACVGEHSYSPRPPLLQQDAPMPKTWPRRPPSESAYGKNSAATIFGLSTSVGCTRPAPRCSP